MKYDKKEPETMDADPMRLLVSAILAFTVMLFINGFVGSMGGFPAFVAFTLVFFRIRTRAGMENGGMQQELSDRQITGRLLWKYAAVQHALCAAAEQPSGNAAWYCCQRSPSP